MRIARAFLLTMALILPIADATPRQAAPTAPEATGPAKPPAALGRLFFTPQQRAEIDRAHRRQSGTAALDEDRDERAAGPAFINGVARRSDGRVTVWVDGRALDRVDQRLAGRITAESVGVSTADLGIAAPASVRKGNPPK